MSSPLILPPDYRPALSTRDIETAIKDVKDFFERQIAEALNLQRVTAPLFVRSGTGINDDLNGVERPVRFPVREDGGREVEIVQSLAKWKRLALRRYGYGPGEGLYTDMNAVRPDEILDNLHSLYVDQWDWERVISAEERNLLFLERIVRKIYEALKQTEHFMRGHYSRLKPTLPDEITFVHSAELAASYPNLKPWEREDTVCRKHGAVFIIGIGAPLKSGEPHDRRAPDYDDWTTLTQRGPGLNGDIIVWYPQLEQAVELSSMGIRVDKAALERQLKMTGTIDRKQLFFHKKLLQGKLPLSIGGGIGQSRLCMFFLRKAHIGEIQVGLWPKKIRERCRAHNIILL